MCRFYTVTNVIASETKQSKNKMDRHTAFAMTDDDIYDDDDEEYEKEWCD